MLLCRGHDAVFGSPSAVGDSGTMEGPFTSRSKIGDAIKVVTTAITTSVSKEFNGDDAALQADVDDDQFHQASSVH